MEDRDGVLGTLRDVAAGSFDVHLRPAGTLIAARRIQELEAQVAAMSEARSMRISHDCEWYLGGIRMKPGVYVVIRVSDEPERSEVSF